MPQVQVLAGPGADDVAAAAGAAEHARDADFDEGGPAQGRDEGLPAARAAPATSSPPRTPSQNTTRSARARPGRPLFTTANPHHLGSCDDPLKPPGTVRPDRTL